MSFNNQYQQHLNSNCQTLMYTVLHTLYINFLLCTQLSVVTYWQRFNVHRLSIGNYSQLCSKRFLYTGLYQLNESIHCYWNMASNNQYQQHLNSNCQTLMYTVLHTLYINFLLLYTKKKEKLIIYSINVKKNFQFKTMCKSCDHTSKTAKINLIRLW